MHLSRNLAECFCKDKRVATSTERRADMGSLQKREVVAKKAVKV
jgi:hypothetical protein